MRHLLPIITCFLLLISSAMSMQQGTSWGWEPDSTTLSDTLRRAPPPNRMLLYGTLGPAFSRKGYGGLFDVVWGHSSSLGFIGIGFGTGADFGSWSDAPVGSMNRHANIRFTYGQHWHTSESEHSVVLGVGTFGGYLTIDRSGTIDSFETTAITADYFYNRKSSWLGYHLFASLSDRYAYVGAGVAGRIASEDVRPSRSDTATDSASVAMRRLRSGRASPGTYYRRIFGEDADQRLGVEWINREQGGGRFYYGIAVNDYLVVSPGTLAVVRSSKDGGLKASVNLLVPGFIYGAGFLLGSAWFVGMGATLFALPNAVLNPTFRLPVVRKHLWLIAEQRSDGFFNDDDNLVFITETAVGAHLSLWRVTFDARYVMPWNTFHLYTSRTPYFSVGVYLGGL